MKLRIILKQYFFSLLATALFFPGILKAQTNEGGFGIWHFAQSGTVILSYDPGSTTGELNYASEIDETDNVPGLSYMRYQPLLAINEKIVLGGEAGFKFFGYYEKQPDTKTFSGQLVKSGGNSGLYLAWQVPLYAAIRVLNGANEDNDEGFGAGTGIGFVAQGFEIPNEKGFMFSPSVMAEIKYNKLGLRFDYNFSKFKSVYKSDTGDIPRLTTSFFTVILTLRFGD